MGVCVKILLPLISDNVGIDQVTKLLLLAVVAASSFAEAE